MMTLNILLHYAQTMTPTVSLLYAHMMTLNTLLYDAQWHPKLHYPQMMTLRTSLSPNNNTKCFASPCPHDDTQYFTSMCPNDAKYLISYT